MDGDKELVFSAYWLSEPVHCMLFSGVIDAGIAPDSEIIPDLVDFLRQTAAVLEGCFYTAMDNELTELANDDS